MLEILANGTPTAVELIRGFAAPVEIPMVRGRSRWPHDDFGPRLKQYLHDASRAPVCRGVGQRVPRFTHASKHFGF